jgi:hypothetical protein
MTDTNDPERLVLRTREDVLPLLAVIAARSQPRTNWVLAMTRERNVELILPLAFDEGMPSTIGLLAAAALPGEAILVVSDRSGEVPADRPDDELIWEEMRGAAAAHDVVLIDWYVVWNTTAFSIAEFAPSGPGW